MKLIMILIKFLCPILLAATVGASTLFFEERAVRAEPVCDGIGTICSKDCQRVLYCPDEGIEAIPLFECALDTFCSTDSGEAMCDASNCRPTIQPCTAEGALPSPFNCANFFICRTLGQDDPPVLVTCSRGVFDTVEFTCSEDLECRAPIVCEEDGQRGYVDPNERQFEYLCDQYRTPIVYPVIAEDDPDNSTSSEPTEPSESPSSDEPGDTTTEIPPTTINPNRCQAQGQRIQDMTDCFAFLVCNRVGDTTPSKTECPSGFYYDRVLLGCVRGDCPYSDIPTESPTQATSEGTTEAPTDGPTDGSSGEPNTTTTTTTTTTPGPTTISPTVCQAPGQRVPTPGDCFSFLTCNSIGDPTPTKKPCPTGYYFDRQLLGCMRGACPYNYFLR